MAHLPYDILYRIAEELAAPSTSLRPDGRARFPFNHPALLHPLLVADPDAAKNLRSCTLVCRSWSVPAIKVNVQHLVIWRASRDAIVAALLRNERYALVHHFQAGREFCPDCSARSRARATSNRSLCTNGVSMQTLLWMLSRCPNVRRLTVHEWLELDAPVDFSTYTTFTGITTFHLVTSVGVSRRLALRSFCQLLRLMPSLKRLSFRGDLSETDVSIDDIPSPDFQLESLAISDPRGVQFASYEWLLANSSNSLHTFWVYGIFDEACVIPCLKGVRVVAATLRTLYLFGKFGYRLTMELGACKNLEELSVEEILILPSVSRVLDPYAKLRRLILTVTSSSSSGVFLGGHPVLNFFTHRELQLLAEILAKPNNAFPELEVLSIETAWTGRIDNPPMEALHALRTTCEARDIAFNFPRLAEIESDTSAIRDVPLLYYE